MGLKKGKPVEVDTEDIRVDNHATLIGLSEVIIIHGIGTGRLGKALREYLSDHPLVKGFREGTQSEGWCRYNRGNLKII